MSFDRGISAIVGPNGCGKSNIVDAIRWVMGEQNPRHLRGRGMDDVIFAGTETVSPVGMAEVVMNLENSDGLAKPPYDGFSEIQITRRLYRSGESEYLINKTPVRLRDVVDFFLDTGVGNRGYTIVEQGRVAELVSTKPEERRIIFEEAAGIGKYRQRRRETERKLDATEQNLLRVTDILGELKRQINSLDRQARKANRYKELTAQVRELELAVAWEDLQGDEARVSEAERTLEGSRAELVARDARVARADSELEASRRSHLDRERELQERSEKLYGVRSEIQGLESRISFERREREGLLSLVEERASESESIQEQLTTSEHELQRATSELAESEQRLHVESRDLEEREKVLRGQNRELSERQGRREALQNQLLRLAAEAATLESRREALDERREEQERRLRESEEALESRSREAEEMGRDEELTRGQLQEAMSEQDQYGRSLAEAIRRQAETREGLEAAQLALGTARAEAQQVSGRLDAVREAEKRESTKVAQVLASLPQRERGAIRGLLTDSIQVQDGFEAAVEAVLAERLQGVLVDNATEALDLLSVLRREKAGRASALVVAAGQPGPDTGIVPLGRPLLEVVGCEASHRPLLERLLRGVYLVDDIGQAVERFGLAEPPATFVSKDGELLDRTGALVGGVAAPAGSLSRQGEIRRLSEQLEKLGARRQELELQDAALTASLDELERELENTRNRRHTAELAVANLEKDLERAQERTKNVSEAVEQHRTGKAGLLSELERVSGERDQAATRLASIGTERSGAEQDRDSLTNELASAQHELERLEQKLVQARVELAELGARRDQLRENRQRLEGQVEESRQWVARRREEIERARERTSSLETSVALAERELAGKLEQEEALRHSQETSRSGYEETSSKLESLEGDARREQTEREAMREQVAAAELGLQEVRMRRDAISERILERYSVDLRSYRPPEEALQGEAEERESSLKRLRSTLQSMGEVHLGAIEEYEEVSERFRYLSEQKTDLEASIEKLRNAISRINRTSRARFRETFQKIDQEFRTLYPRMFRGGRAELSLTESEDVLDAGIEITAQPPGKKLQNVNLLSGGEKSLTALALLFAVFKVKPSPFFLLDEVDAALDDANVGRFDELLVEVAANSQFLVITHNKSSIESADKLFGVTMQQPGLSKLVTVDLVS